MHVITFTAGGASAAAQAASSADLARRLRGARVDIVSLAPEMGCADREALSAVAEALNAQHISAEAPCAALRAQQGAGYSSASTCSDWGQGGAEGASSGGATCPNMPAPGQDGQRSADGGGQARARLIWLDPPAPGLEAWQQLEPLLEQLEASGWPIRAHQPGTQPEAGPTPPAAEQQAAWPSSEARARSRRAVSLRRGHHERAAPAPAAGGDPLEQGLGGSGAGSGTGARSANSRPPSQVHACPAVAPCSSSSPCRPTWGQSACYRTALPSPVSAVQLAGIAHRNAWQLGTLEAGSGSSAVRCHNTYLEPYVL